MAILMQIFFYKIIQAKINSNKKTKNIQQSSDGNIVSRQGEN